MSDHTPGPWSVGDKRGVWVGPVVMADDGKRGIAFVCGESDAHARLIAAAPELLAALKVADDALDFAQAQVNSERDANQLRGWRRDVQRAIATAEGRGE